MDTTELNSATPASVPSTSGRRVTFTLVPTLIGYAAFGSLVLGLIHSNGWLFALGLIVLIPVAILLFGSTLLLMLGMWSMRRHPERYETQFIEDAQGGTKVKWVRIR